MQYIPLDKSMSPKKTPGKFVGVELEIVSKVPKEVLAWEFLKMGLKDYINIGYDGSIKKQPGYRYTHEIRCLTPQKQYKEVMTKVCKVLNKTGCKANKSCGLHVHLDMRKRNVKRCYTKLVDSLPILKNIVKKYRYDEQHSYNKLNRINDFVTATEGKKIMMKIPSSTDPFGTVLPAHNRVVFSDSIPRNSAINPHSYKKHKTLEVRLKEGTVDSKDINKWISKLVTIVDGKAA